MEIVVLKRYFEKFSNGNKNLLDQFRNLRMEVLARRKEEIRNRLENDPNPSKEEILVGAFREQIEPQVRDAVFELSRKGYRTTSSGFGRKGSQIIEGNFIVDEDIKRQIQDFGVHVLIGQKFGLPENRSRIIFYPERADLTEIKRKWDAVVNIFPTVEITELLDDRSEAFKNRYPERDMNIINSNIKSYFNRE